MDPISGSTRLAGILHNLNSLGGFSISVLTDRDGLLLASACSPDWDSEKQAAVVAVIQRAAQQTEGVEMGRADEVTVRDSQGRRLVCRPFAVMDRVLILGVLAENGRAYRRATNDAVREIRRTWGD
jgi:predicted regulator of Ras-like GTPase activity (Roadblock/LC7/MglB family)